MLKQAVDLPTVEPIHLLSQDSPPPVDAIVPIAPLPDSPLSQSPLNQKAEIRSSLKASTLDCVFAVIFTNIAGGVLLSNFLLELDASPMQIGMLCSIPMMVNFLQPIGAYLSSRSASRREYSRWIYAPARLLWLGLVLGIVYVSGSHHDPHILVPLTLMMVFVTNVLGAFGSASWMSWMAVLVPRRLRGRYFGIRNSAASLTSLLCVPLLGWMVSIYPGGMVQGYGFLLGLGVIAGLVSLYFQGLIKDFNPQVPVSTVPAFQAKQVAAEAAQADSSEAEGGSPANSDLQQADGILQNPNFLMFLLYVSLWTFSVNLCAPFFNVYLLDNLNLDLNWVTLYNSLGAGANLLMIVFWGKLADRIGNRPILFFVGLLVALTPILWLGTGADSGSIWLWFPLLHILGGATWAGIDLCSNNIQMGVAPPQKQANYFAAIAAIGGIGGALGTTAGGFMSQMEGWGGLSGLFLLSGLLRFVALGPLLLVREQRPHSIGQLLQVLGKPLDWLGLNRWRSPVAPVPVPVVELTDQA